MTAKITSTQTHYFPGMQTTVIAASVEENGVFHSVLVGRSRQGFKPLTIGNAVGKSDAMADIEAQLERINAGGAPAEIQKRIEDAVFEIDAHLLAMRESINIHRIKTHDDELTKIIELINMSRGTGALQPKVHGLLAIYTMCHVQATNHLFKETSVLLRQTAADIGELLKNLIVKE